MTVLELQNPVVLFDGMCNLCSGSVQFIIHRDPDALFKFASIQSAIGKKLAENIELPKEIPDSLVLIEDNKYYFKSTGALRILKRLGYVWRILYILILIPEPVRDFFYDIVARNRYNWYGKRSECLVPTPEIKSRFLE